MNVRSVNGLQSADGSLRDLAALGQLRGSLTVEDIRQALPIDRMTDDDVARTIAYLEDRGIEVLLDPSLLLDSGRATREQPHRRTVSNSTPKVIPITTESSHQLARGEPAREPPPADLGRSSSATAYVLLAAVLMAILAVILFWTVW